MTSKIFRRAIFTIVSMLFFTVAFFTFKFSFNASAQIEETPIQPEAIRFSENFDGVTAPQLPAGWLVASTGAGANFATTTNSPDSAPNAVFTVSPPTTSSTALTSPPIYVASPNTILNFRNKFAMENTWDGGILEISVAGGAFQDITATGGSFITGGYNGVLNPSTNPLGSRFAWTGQSQNGYQATSVQLPPNAFRQFVQFRWRFGSNDSFGNEGWFIDTISLETISTGANAASITIPSSGTASQFPSEIQISGLPGFVTGVMVDLGNFSHTAPDDVDILLVAPNGRSLVLMSDAGGGTPVSNLGITFDDSAAQNLPDEAPLTSDSFKPTNYESGDVFPAPAPQMPPTITTLGGFVGSPPNGAWRLYLVDDNGNNAGSITGGWSLTLQSSVNACPLGINPGIQAFPNTGGSGSFQLTTPTGCGWTAVTNSSFVTITSNANGDGDSLLNFNVAPNFGGGRTATITVSNGLTTRNFQVQQASGCPFSLAQSSQNFSAAGGSGSVQVTANAACSWLPMTNANWIQTTSAQQSGNGTATFTVQPNTTSNWRSANIIIGAQTLTVNQAGASAKAFDFDGDGKSDVSVFRPSNNTWYLQQSANGFSATQFGVSTDRLVPADYDGDRKTDIAVWRGGDWFILQSSNNTFRYQQWGLPTNDAPIPADYDGDGKADFAVWRTGPEVSSPGSYIILQSASGNLQLQSFGITGTDKPVPADYDGDGRADITVYREAGGNWFILQSSSGSLRVEQFGIGNFQDKPLPRDYDGDGKTDFAVFRASNATWYLLGSASGFSATQFGVSSDRLVPADYDGDGKADIAVYRDGTWFILRSQLGFSAIQFGTASDTPVLSAF